MVGKLTTDEEEMTTLQLSVMIVLQDKIWGRDGRFLNGHDIKDVLDSILFDEFGWVPFEVDGDILGQGIMKYSLSLKKYYGFEMERARNVSYMAYNSMPAVDCRGRNRDSRRVRVVSNTERRSERLLDLQLFKDVVAEKKMELHHKAGLASPRHTLSPVLPRGKHSSHLSFPSRSEKYQLNVCSKMMEHWQSIGEDPRYFIEGAKRMISFAQHSPSVPTQVVHKKDSCVPWSRSLLEIAVKGAKEVNGRVEFTSDQKAAIQVRA